MRIVVDTSVTVKWFVRDTDAEAHLRMATALLLGLRDGNLTALQPPHWIAEVLAVISRIRPRRSDSVLALLPRTATCGPASVSTYRRASEIAKATGAHLFDTLYHAVALEEAATLVTADEAYLAKAARYGSIVHLGAIATLLGMSGQSDQQ